MKTLEPWRGNVQLVGGIGGFGVVADAAIESVTRNIVTNVLPVETRTHVCYASPGHMFCPQAESFTDAVLNQYQQCDTLLGLRRTRRGDAVGQCPADGRWHTSAGSQQRDET